LTEEDLVGPTTSILADLGVNIKHSKHDTMVLAEVYDKLASLYSLMPNKIQNSFVELSSKFDIDPDFNMLNDATE